MHRRLVGVDRRNMVVRNHQYEGLFNPLTAKDFFKKTDFRLRQFLTLKRDYW